MTTDPKVTIRQIYSDFSNEQPPFSIKNFPERKLLQNISCSTSREKGFLLTLFCTLDYNRDAFQLADNIIELRNDHNFPLSEEVVYTDYEKGELESTFTEIGFRYPSRDAKGVLHNCELIVENYGDTPSLLQDVGYSATSLVERLNSDNFLYLKGKKLAPFYARLVSEHIHPLSDVWELDIPVDTHIRRLSRDLFEEDLSDDEIRSKWREYGDKLDISPAVVDGGLWLIGNNWGEWGEEYWETISE